MEPQLWKICPACSDIPVPGCESLTDEQVADFYTDNKQHLEEPAPCGDVINYIQIPINNLEKFILVPEGEKFD